MNRVKRTSEQNCFFLCHKKLTSKLLHYLRKYYKKIKKFLAGKKCQQAIGRQQKTPKKRKRRIRTKPKIITEQILPDDIVMNILLQMDYQDLIAGCRSNKQFYRICYGEQSDFFWKIKLEYDYSIINLFKNKTWRQTYQLYYLLQWANHILKTKYTISQLFNLRKLDLQLKKLTSVPKELGQLSNLQELKLEHNKLTSIPKELGQLSNLQELKLEYNNLTSIPKELGQLSNLQDLNLQGNKLTSVAEELGQLFNLRKLDLGYNNLTSVPKELGQLSNLQELNLQINKLTSIPKELGQLSNLWKLTLWDNKLTSIPKELGQLSNLLELGLLGNELTRIPKKLRQISDLA